MSTNSVIEKIIILGTGPAGLTAAIYTARANLKPLCVEGAEPGGQLMLTSDVENYPGFENPLTGSELMDRFRKQATRFGTRFERGWVRNVSFHENPFQIELESGKKLLSETVLIATGASAKWLGIPSETRLRGKGVSACATCDGFFFKNCEVAVVGGGDTAMEEALFLTRFAKKVYVIHRRDQLRASKIMQERAKKHPKISLVWNSAVEEVLGEKEVTGLKLKNTQTGEISELKVSGLFLGIGHQPNTKPFVKSLELNPAGYVVVRHGTTRTSVSGVFAAGDVMDPTYRQAVTAAGTGCMAAIEIERYLESKAFS